MRTGWDRVVEEGQSPPEEQDRRCSRTAAETAHERSQGLPGADVFDDTDDITDRPIQPSTGMRLLPDLGELYIARLGDIPGHPSPSSQGPGYCRGPACYWSPAWSISLVSARPMRDLLRARLRSSR